MLSLYPMYKKRGVYTIPQYWKIMYLCEIYIHIALDLNLIKQMNAYGCLERFLLIDDCLLFFFRSRILAIFRSCFFSVCILALFNHILEMALSN